MIEFQDAEHERLMQTIAARLGFDLVSLRLELFGRRSPVQTPAASTRAGSGPSGRDPRREAPTWRG